MSFKTSLLSVLTVGGLCAGMHAASAQTTPTLPAPETVRGWFTPQAQNITFSTGGAATGTANVTFNPIAANGTGTMVGSATINGVNTALSCTYNIITNTVSGGAACSQVLSGSNLAGFARTMVAQRLSYTASVLSQANTAFTGNMLEARLTNDLIIRVQGEAQGGAQSTGANNNVNFGSGYGSYGLGGVGWYDDNRLGQNKDADSFVLTAGFDKAAGKVLFGGTVGYIDQNVDLESLNGDLDSQGYLGGVYVGYLFNNVWSMTASGTYVSSDVDVARTSGTTLITSTYDQTEYNAALMANAFNRVGDLGLTFTFGAGYDRWKTDAYTDSANIAYGAAKDDNWTGRVGGVISLLSTQGVTPYATVMYNHILSDRNYGQDRGSLDASAGLSVRIGTGFMGSVEVSKTFMQQDQDSVTAGLHFRFIL
jgi:hypothetical protein